MKKIFIACPMFCFFSLVAFSQKVIISNPAKKEIYWTNIAPPAPVTITFTAIDCDAASFAGIDCWPIYSASTCKAPVFNSFAYTVPATYHSGSINLGIVPPTPVPDKPQIIVLKFRLNLKDTSIFNYDTLTILKTPPAEPTDKAQWRLKDRKQYRWKKDPTNGFKSEITQFTDFNGFDNQKPNGLLQEELVLKFPLAKNRRGLNYKQRENTYYQYFRSIVFTGLFNRIDKTKNFQDYPVGSTLPYIPGNKDSIQNYLTTMDLFKYSNLQLGVNFNVFTLHAGNFRFNLDYEFGVLRNRPYFADTIKILDTFVTKNDLRHIYSFVHKVEFYANNNQLIGKDFGAAFNGGIMLVRLRDSYYKQFDAASIDPFGRANVLLPANEKRTARPIWFFTGTFSKKWGEDKKSTTFLRVSYNYQTGSYTNYTGDPKVTPGNYSPSKFRTAQFHNHFLQLQLGVSLVIDKLLESKK